MIGRTIAHYEVTAKLGAGGMGEVYRAHDEHLKRDVALKVLPPAFLHDATARARLLREARSVAALNHPSICTIFEVGETEGLTYLAMELVEGEPLNKRLASGPLPPEQVLRYGSQIAGALAHAHERQIVHRDLKSANVIITPDDRAKVLDFGLAKCLSQGELDEVTRSQASLTQPGAIVGTLPCVAPEELLGQPADARSDIWALGVVLYEMACGTRPFQGQTGLGLSSAILHKTPAPMPEQVPGALQVVTFRCLEKEPSQRYQRASEVRAALEALQAGVPALPSFSSGGKSRLLAMRARTVNVLLVALLTAGIFVWLKWRPPENTEPLSAVPLTTLPGVVRSPSFSPDGDRVAFSWSGTKQDNPDIYVQQIGAGSPLRLTVDVGNDFNPVWAPDGRWIAFLRGQPAASKSELRLIPPLGGTERKLAEILIRGGSGVTPPYLAWCPDSSCLIVTDSPGEGKPDALFLISVETGEKRQLTHPMAPASGDTNPAVSPDGRWLVFRRMANLFAGELYRLSLERGFSPIGEPHRITEARLNGEHPTWTSNSQEVIFSARSALWRMRVDEENAPTRLPFVGEYGQMAVVSRSQPGKPSRLVYVREFMDGNIWSLTTSAPGALATSPPKAAISSTRLDDMPQVSPDGRRVALTSDRSGSWEIWLTDLDGSNSVQLTHLEAVASGYPHWSPDGQQIAFHINLDGQWEVYTVSAGGGKPKNVTASPATDSVPSYSRDGKWIYFSSNRAGQQFQSVWKVPVDGGNPVQVISTESLAPQESTDGVFLYYLDAIGGPSALWRVPTSGGAAEKVLDGVILFNYAVLPRGIYFVDRVSGSGVHYVDMPLGETRLRYFDLATRRTTTVFRNLGPVDTPIAVTPDGRTIFYPRMDAFANDLMLVERFR